MEGGAGIDDGETDTLYDVEGGAGIDDDETDTL